MLLKINFVQLIINLKAKDIHYNSLSFIYFDKWKYAIFNRLESIHGINRILLWLQFNFFGKFFSLCKVAIGSAKKSHFLKSLAILPQSLFHVWWSVERAAKKSYITEVPEKCYIRIHPPWFLGNLDKFFSPP